MRAHGSHGPSGLDADEWRKILTNYGQYSIDLCKTIVQLAQQIAREKLTENHLEAYNACRLIPLDKFPGIRLIGIGEVLRRIIGRCIIRCISKDLLTIGNATQLCLGQKCGIEHAIHLLRETYQQPETEAILPIDASNAFNALNRKLAMRNNDSICPSLTSAVYNSYIYPSKLFVNGETLLSEEGTTQGDPIAMAIYGISILPIIRKFNPSIVQKWYANDGNMAGTLPDLLDAFKTLESIGKAFGYFVNAPKCQLIVKNCLLTKAERIFKNSEVENTDVT